MKVFLHYEDNDDTALHKSLKITLPKSWKNGPSSKLLGQFVESYNNNATLGESNPLKEEDVHLAMRVEDDRSSSSSPEGGLVDIASDAITINTIPDRADVYILHGPSKTLAQIAEERRIAAEQQKKEQESLVSCVRFGCKKRFPPGGPYPDCCYHVAPPVFHETAKFWSCCPNKKAYDWDDFQQIKGCQTGVCTDVKEEGAGKTQKQFLGGCDLREAAGEASKLKSIDDFNKAQAAGGSDAAPVLDRLRSVMGEIGVENELFDQVVDGMKREQEGKGVEEKELLGVVSHELGKKLKDAMKGIAVEQLRIK